MTGCFRTIARVAGVALLVVASGCTNYYEVSVETPLQPKIDVSRFQRILIAGFITGGTEEVDTNLETARLLRSQLRTRSSLEVIDADVIQLLDVAKAEEEVSARRGESSVSSEPPTDATAGDTDTLSEEDLETYDRIFANVSYWRQLGEEYQSPLIITGTIYFSPHQRSGMVTREREIYDAFGRRQVMPVRAYRDRRGYVLSHKFIFIDGDNGTMVYTERHREEILYDSSQNTPALSTFFELMDRVLPSFLGVLSDQSVRGTRTLLK